METPKIKLREGLNEIQSLTIKMIRLTEEMFDDSLKALRLKNIILAKKVIADDDKVDHLNFEIEKRGLSLIVTQQPMARDFRIIVAILRMIKDIERVGDYSLDIAKFIKEAIEEKFLILPVFPEISEMAEITKKMIEEIQDIFFQEKNKKELVQRITEIIDDDERVDKLYLIVNEKCIDYFSKGQKREIVKNVLLFLKIARFIERIADHLTNIAESLHYKLTGDLKELHLE